MNGLVLGLTLLVLGQTEYRVVISTTFSGDRAQERCEAWRDEQRAQRKRAGCVSASDFNQTMRDIFR